MPITVSAPPAKKRGTTAAPAQGANKITPVAPPLSKKAEERSEGLQGWAQIAGLICVSRKWYADAGAIGIHGQKICDEAARIADDDERLGKYLDYLTMTGPYAALFSAAIPFAAQILVNHRRIGVPLGMQGVLPAEALEAKVQSEVMTMQAEALKEQVEAQKALAEAQAFMNEVQSPNGANPHD